MTESMLYYPIPESSLTRQIHSGELYFESDGKSLAQLAIFALRQNTKRQTKNSMRQAVFAAINWKQHHHGVVAF